MINYGPTWLLGDTVLDTTGLERLRQVPFWFGLARGGDHTFLGHEDRVSEFHRSAKPTDGSHMSIEERTLVDFPWNSGVIMTPPGTWPAM